MSHSVAKWRLQRVRQSTRALVTSLDAALRGRLLRLLPPKRPRPRGALRVGYVLWQFPQLSETFIHSEIQWLQDHGVKVTVLYRSEPDRPATLDFEVPSHLVSTSWEILYWIRRYRLQLLHSHFVYPTVTRLTWPAAERARLPFTFMPHALDLFEHEAMQRNRLKQVATSPCCASVFAYGEFQRRFLVERGVPEERVVLKPQSFHSSLLDAPYRPTRPPLRRVVFVGRFVEKKGLDDLIRTAERVRDLDLQFDIYGYGPLENALRKQAEGVSNVRLHVGGLPYAEYQRVMRESDLLFLPCKRASDGDMDGLPTVLMEAAVIGLPVLTTDISSIPLLVQDGVTGFACRAGDVAGFEQKLRQLVEVPAVDLELIINSARRRTLETCAPDVVNQALVDCWRETLEGRPADTPGGEDP